MRGSEGGRRDGEGGGRRELKRGERVKKEMYDIVLNNQLCVWH